MGIIQNITFILRIIPLKETGGNICTALQVSYKLQLNTELIYLYINRVNIKCTAKLTLKINESEFVKQSRL